MTKSRDKEKRIQRKQEMKYKKRRKSEGGRGKELHEP